MQVQLELFSQTTLNIMRDLKIEMNMAAKSCKLSREEIVDRMNALADRYGVTLVSGNATRLKLETLEKWLNENAMSWQPPLKALPIFCAVVGSHKPMHVLAAPLGFQVIGAEEQKLLAWAKANINAREARKTMRRIESELSI